jgi:hypothetical protein
LRRIIPSNERRKAPVAPLRTGVRPARASYNEEAAHEARELLLLFLKKHLS